MSMDVECGAPVARPSRSRLPLLLPPARVSPHMALSIDISNKAPSQAAF